jgi:hypothetical protein
MEKIEGLSDVEFRRLTGVKKETFKKMLEILAQFEIEKKKLSGRPSKLPLEQR